MINRTLLALALFALITGIGTAAIGAGGIFLIIALYVFTPISPSTIAGTMSATSIATALLVTYYALNTDELLHGAERTLAVLLSVTGALGAVVGAELNTTLSEATFGVVLGGFTAVVGLLLIYRRVQGVAPAILVDPTVRRGQIAFGGFGFIVGVIGSVFGIGGPVIATPVLVLLGTPLMAAVAVAQIQSIFLSGSATLAYAAHGAVSGPLVIALGIPQLIGVVLGWQVAHRVEAARLELVLGAVLLIVGGYVAM